MSNITFQQAQQDSTFLEGILVSEGGYVNDPVDPGGETNFGISKRMYPNLNIKTLTEQDAIAIYQKDFLERERFHFGLSNHITYKLTDIAINAGPHAAHAILQSALNHVIGKKVLQVDGLLAKDGGNTKKVYEQIIQDPNIGEDKLMNAIIQHQKQYYKALDPKLVSKYGKGWENRANYNPIKGEHTRK
jgi:lysozyme family protein